MPKVWLNDAYEKGVQYEVTRVSKIKLQWYLI